MQPDISPSHSHPTPPQELACRIPGPGGKKEIELLRLCGYYCTVPAPYQLKSVAKEGDHPQSSSKQTEVWKGWYNGEVVAIKILRGPEGDAHVRNTKRVSTICDPRESSPLLS